MGLLAADTLYAELFRRGCQRGEVESATSPTSLFCCCFDVLFMHEARASSCMFPVLPKLFFSPDFAFQKVTSEVTAIGKLREREGRRESGGRERLKLPTASFPSFSQGCHRHNTHLLSPDPFLIPSPISTVPCFLRLDLCIPLSKRPKPSTRRWTDQSLLDLSLPPLRIHNLRNPQPRLLLLKLLSARPSILPG